MSNIMETAVQQGSFNTFCKALRQAEMEKMLGGPGPFTVFAPTDAAFGKLSPEEMSELMDDQESLYELLSYHIVAGRRSAADISRLRSLKTLQGQELVISAREGIEIDKARVLQADVPSDNGLIHVIDAVLSPR